MHRLKKIGTLRARKPWEFQQSRLGIGFEKLDRAVFDPEKAYDKLADIGVKWIRLQSGWQRTERSPGVYDFDWLDSIVDNLIRRGMQPWMCLCYGNELYDERAKTIFGAVGCPPIHTEEQRTAWYNYVKAVAEHYAGRVNAFEIWNEPDGNWCWKHGVNATEYGEFSVNTAKALRAGNPDTYIIGGALCLNPCAFLHKAMQTGMGDVLDALSFHEYVYDEGLVKEKVRALRGIANFWNPKLEIIQGESGAQSRPDGHGALKEGNWTPERQAKILLRHMTADLLCGVKFTSFFTCVDMIEALNGTVGDKASYLDYGYFGVLGADFDENGFSTGDYVPKKSYYALQNLNAVLGGTLLNIDLPVTVNKESSAMTGWAPALSACDVTSGGFRLDNGAYALAYWYPANLMTTDYTGTVTMSESVSDEVHLVDPMDGSVYELPESMIHHDGFGSCRLIHIPIKDYPMFLIFGELPAMNEDTFLSAGR